MFGQLGLIWNGGRDGRVVEVVFELDSGVGLEGGGGGGADVEAVVFCSWGGSAGLFTERGVFQGRIPVCRRKRFGVRPAICRPSMKLEMRSVLTLAKASASDLDIGR